MRSSHFIINTEGGGIPPGRRWEAMPKSVMKHLTLFVVLLGVLCFAMNAQARTVQELVGETKKPITLKASKSHHLDVVFNHSSHKGVNCFTCHHMASDSGRYVSCSSCHTVKGKSKDPQSAFMAFHAKSSSHSCYSCHKSLAKEKPERYGKAFYNCRPCHLPPSQRMATTK